jgi:hypothetical protein
VKSEKVIAAVYPDEDHDGRNSHLVLGSMFRTLRAKVQPFGVYIERNGNGRGYAVRLFTSPLSSKLGGLNALAGPQIATEATK